MHGSMIYFLKSRHTGLVKIGITTDVWSRRAHLQRELGERLELILAFGGTRQDERRLHLHFGRDCIQGEWFRPSKELLGFVARARMSQREDARTASMLNMVIDGFYDSLR